MISLAPWRHLGVAHLDSPRTRWTGVIGLALLGFAAEAQAQIVPPGLQGLPTYGEVRYGPGGIPPNGPIASPEEDKDYIQYAMLFWEGADAGTFAKLDLFNWSAPKLIELVQTPPHAQVDEWGGGVDLFEAVYFHRLAPYNPTGFADLHELIENDAQVATLFKHWTLHHQLATSPQWDTLAHDNHKTMLVEAYTFGMTTSVRGVPLIDGNMIVSDRLELLSPSAWFPQLAYAADDAQPDPSEPASDAQKEAQECIDAKKEVLDDMDWKEDGKGKDGTPGFDCDDFADAMGAAVSKDKEGVTANTVFVSWTSKPDGNGLKKGKGKHLVTKISAGGKYWLMDGQTGAVSGPHDDGTPMDAEPVLDGPLGNYDYEPGSVRTKQTERDLDYRPTSEPPPWHKNPDMVACFEKLTGLDADCFIPQS